MSPVAVNESPNGSSVSKKMDATEKLVLNTIRCLTADIVQEYKGGHPGTPMGAAAIGTALWRYNMRYNPKNPDWFNRDRFILSAGHACLLQYIHLHFTGYEAWTMDELKTYHNPKFGIAAGHPEIEFPGVEVTTGPLGQGISNAVGLAIAGKNLAANYNQPGFDIVDNTIWCFTGDGCIQEGVGQEALSLAGHLKLDNLVVIYDNNAITVDGNTSGFFTEDSSMKMEANGFHVIDVLDGTNDLHTIIKALDDAKNFKGKPVFVHIRTVIGFGSQNASTHPVHGAALGAVDVAHVKSVLGFDPQTKYHVPREVYEFFKPCIARGAEDESAWNKLYASYAKKHPDLYEEIQQRLTGSLPAGWKNELPAKSALPTTPQPTRKSSGIVVDALVPKYRNFMAGSADVMESTFVKFKNQVEFQAPQSGLGDYSGRQIRYGIREFAMVGIANGLVAYQNSMFIPIVSTFFQFWIYAAPAARMSALQGLRFIGVGTHDSIGIGEDGPTHQTIGLASLYRAMPNTNFIRPADVEETIGAWELALGEVNIHTPSLFAFSRQAVPLLEGSDRVKVAMGAYPVFSTTPASVDADHIIIISTGSEVYKAIEVAKRLPETYKITVVSMPSQSHFDRQPAAYRKSVLGDGKAIIIAIEAWSSYGWARYAHASLSMHTFGLSAPQETLYEVFGFGLDNMVTKIGNYVKSKIVDGKMVVPGVGDFEELLLGYYKH